MEESIRPVWMAVVIQSASGICLGVGSLGVAVVDSSLQPIVSPCFGASPALLGGHGWSTLVSVRVASVGLALVVWGILQSKEYFRAHDNNLQVVLVTNYAH